MSSIDNTFIIGDLHGCYDELQDLLSAASASLSRHRIIFVGDIINKGPKSFKILQWVRDNGVETVIGNHELRFLKGLRQGQSLSPALKELKSQMGKQLDLWVGWIDSFPNFINDRDFWVVHGGFQPGVDPEKTPRSILATIRTWEGSTKQMYRPGAPAWHSFYSGNKPVFYGHWAIQGIHINNNTYCLDSGCVYGKTLTGIWAGEKKMISVPARRAYCPLF